MEFVKQQENESGLEFAIRAIEESRDVHLQWIDWIVKAENTEKNRRVIKVAGNAAHHKQCVDKYDHVLRVLKRRDNDEL